METWLRKNAALSDFRISKENRAQLAAAREVRKKADVLEDQMDKRAVIADIQSNTAAINSMASRPENRIVEAGPDVGRPRLHSSMARDSARAGFAVPASLAGYRLRTSLGVPRRLVQVNGDPYEPPSEEELENDRTAPARSRRSRMRKLSVKLTTAQRAEARRAKREADRARGTPPLGASQSGARGSV